jgi:hypothetical protein
MAGEAESDERFGRALEQLCQRSIRAAHAAVDPQHRDAVRKRLQDLAGEVAGREQGIAVAVEAPEDRAAQHHEGRRAEARHLDAEVRQHSVGHGSDRKGREEPDHHPDALARSPGEAERR